jgi:hypothetical protein
MGALQVATQYPLQSKAFTWPLSALYLLSCNLNSALHHHACIPAAPFPTIVGDDKTIKSHYKTSKHLPCSPISIRVSRMNNQLQLVYSAVMTFTVTGHALFNLNTQKTVANDKFYKRSA